MMLDWASMRNDLSGQSLANGTPTVASIIAAIRNQVEAMRPIDKRWLILAPLKAVNDTNSDLYDYAAAQLRLAFPRHYVDMCPPTVEEMATTGYTLTPQDNTDVANGYFPSGMRNYPTDLLHLNASGQAIIALRVDRAFQRLGWMQ